MVLLRLGAAAERLGVHPGTLRLWADAGTVASVRVGRERRFEEADLDAVLGRAAPVRQRQEALYARVLGTAGQEWSLQAQEQALRATASGAVVAVYRDRACGLGERRPGLDRLLAAAAQGRFTVVRVTGGDRLARFGLRWLEALLARDGVGVEVLHPRARRVGCRSCWTASCRWWRRLRGGCTGSARARPADGCWRPPRSALLAALPATASCTAYRAVAEATGEVVGQPGAGRAGGRACHARPAACRRHRHGAVDQGRP